MPHDAAGQNVDMVRKAVGAGTLGFGVLGTVAPGALRRAYGDTTSTGAALDYFERTWGTRNVLLGALVLSAGSEAESRRLAQLAAVMNSVDSLVGFTATGLRSPTRFAAALSSAAFAAASFYVARNG